MQSRKRKIFNVGEHLLTTKTNLDWLKLFQNLVSPYASIKFLTVEISKTLDGTVIFILGLEHSKILNTKEVQEGGYEFDTYFPGIITRTQNVHFSVEKDETAGRYYLDEAASILEIRIENLETTNPENLDSKLQAAYEKIQFFFKKIFTEGLFIIKSKGIGCDSWLRDKNDFFDQMVSLAQWRHGSYVFNNDCFSAADTTFQRFHNIISSYQVTKFSEYTVNTTEGPPYSGRYSLFRPKNIVLKERSSKRLRSDLDQGEVKISDENEQKSVAQGTNISPDYLLFDNDGREYLMGHVLSRNLSIKNKIELIRRLILLHKKGIFNDGIITLQECLKVSSFGLFILDDTVFNEYGVAAFKKGFIKAADFVSIEWTCRPGFLAALFTKEGMMALEAGCFTVKQVLACKYNEDCKRLIYTAYDKLAPIAAPALRR